MQFLYTSARCRIDLYQSAETLFCFNFGKARTKLLPLLSNLEQFFFFLIKEGLWGSLGLSLADLMKLGSKKSPNLGWGEGG